MCILNACTENICKAITGLYFLPQSLDKNIFMTQYSMCLVRLQSHSHPCNAKLRFQFWISAHTALVLRVLSVALHHQQPLIQFCQHVAFSFFFF